MDGGNGGYPRRTLPSVSITVNLTFAVGGGFPKRLLACRAAACQRSVHSEYEIMDKQSVERLRFDRRLKTRSGWVDADQEAAYIAALPDVSDKMTTCAEEENAAEAAAAEPPLTAREPELHPQTPAPVAGDFSTSISSVTQSAPPSQPTAPSSSSATPEAAPADPAPDSADPSSDPIDESDQGSAGTFRSEGGYGSDSNSDGA